jgi:hypothetical protein
MIVHYRNRFFFRGSWLTSFSMASPMFIFACNLLTGSKCFGKFSLVLVIPLSFPPPHGTELAHADTVPIFHFWPSVK